MASRSTLRPITPLRPSISEIASAGTSRRRREKRPERTAIASGTSAAVPYIGPSTRPDHAAARVGDEKAGRSEKLRSGHAHAGGTYTGPVTENRSRRKRFVNHHSPGFGGPAVTPSYNRQMDVSARHLRLLTETIAAVNSTLDLEEVLGLVARKVAEALEADACFVYLYHEQADELVLRATHGTRVEEMTRTPRMRPGEGITGTAAAERSPI